MSTAIVRAIELLIEAEVERRVAELTTAPAALLTVDEFATQARLAKSTVYGLIRDGKVRPSAGNTRRVLIPASELDRWLAVDGAA